MEDTIRTIFKTTALDKKTLIETGLKAAEELGELSEAILSYSQVSACGYKQLTADDVVEEAVDVIIVCLAAIVRAKPEIEVAELDQRVRAKVEKWIEKINVTQNQNS